MRAAYGSEPALGTGVSLRYWNLMSRRRVLLQETTSYTGYFYGSAVMALAGVTANAMTGEASLLGFAAHGTCCSRLHSATQAGDRGQRSHLRERRPAGGVPPV